MCAEALVQEPALDVVPIHLKRSDLHCKEPYRTLDLYLLAVPGIVAPADGFLCSQETFSEIGYRSKAPAG